MLCLCAECAACPRPVVLPLTHFFCKATGCEELPDDDAAAVPQVLGQWVMACPCGGSGRGGQVAPMFVMHCQCDPLAADWGGSDINSMQTRCTANVRYSC